jgi:uncharacterized protein YqeY
MALKEQIDNDLKTALLGGNRLSSTVLRSLKAVILDEEVAKGKRDEGLDDVSIEQIVAREIKKRNESANIFENAGRPELANDERAESEVLSAYLPTQATEAEIKEVIERVKSELGANSPSMMGQVIGAVKTELGNSADGGLIAKLVKESLI